MDDETIIVVKIKKNSKLGQKLIELAKKSETIPEKYAVEIIENWLIFHRSTK